MYRDNIQDHEQQSLKQERILSIDALRGVAVFFMLVDHVREFFFLHQQVSDPMILAQTDSALAITRLTSHICATVFIYLAGISAFLYARRYGLNAKDETLYLLKRGTIFIVLELTIINFAWIFNFQPNIFYLQVIWAIGISMVCLAFVNRIPTIYKIVIASVLMAGHNLLDGLHLNPDDTGFAIWAILHDRGIIEIADIKFRTSYPVLPWIGLIILGYASGDLYQRHVLPPIRQKRLMLLGIASLGIFMLLRILNVYGEKPMLWSSDFAFNAISFLNLTKYPPSLQFLLFTMGIGWLGLAIFERFTPYNKLVQLGRMPMVFYVVHLYGLHLLYLLALGIYGYNQGTRYGFDSVWQIWLASFVVLPLFYVISVFWNKGLYSFKGKTKS